MIHHPTLAWSSVLLRSAPPSPIHTNTKVDGSKCFPPFFWTKNKNNNKIPKRGLWRHYFAVEQIGEKVATNLPSAGDHRKSTQFENHHEEGLFSIPFRFSLFKFPFRLIPVFVWQPRKSIHFIHFAPFLPPCTTSPHIKGEPRRHARPWALRLFVA